MSSIPVLIIGYQRKDELLKLARFCVEHQMTRIYISLDGPANKLVATTQQEIVREIMRLRECTPSLELTLFQRNSNGGSGAGVLWAVEKFFENEKEGIILEDDLRIDASFFGYVESALKKYSSNEQILMIGGSNLFEKGTGASTLIPYPISWGWATSKDKWERIRKLIFIEMDGKKCMSQPNEWFYWFVGKRRALKGFTDAWDIPLAASMWSFDYYTLVPPVNFISNHGYGDSATHTLDLGWPLGLKTESWKETFISEDFDKNTTARNSRFMRRKIYSKSIWYLPKGIISLALDLLIRERGKPVKSLKMKFVED